MSVYIPLWLLYALAAVALYEIALICVAHHFHIYDWLQARVGRRAARAIGMTIGGPVVWATVLLDAYDDLKYKREAPLREREAERRRREDEAWR
jgi:uncharacterized RDD family membrane protein YckC